MVEVLFEGRVCVDYHQFYLESGEAEGTFTEAFEGQENGLLGGGVPGALTVSVGTALGNVGLRVLLRDDEPAEPGLEWEDVVEVSFTPAGREVGVREPLGGPVVRFGLPAADYRVRLCARGIDDAWDGTVGEDEPLVDHYELTFWPAAPAADAVVRLTSRNEVAAHRARDPELAREDLAAAWEGDPPDDRLVADGLAEWFTRLDRPLAEALLAAGPLVQRQVAYWAAERGLRESGIVDLDVVAAGLWSLRADRPLPPPFTDPGWMYQVLDDHPENPRRVVRVQGHENDQGGAALFAVLQAIDPDPLDAAFSAISGLRGVVGDEGAGAVLAAARAALAQLVEELGPEPRPDSRASVPHEDVGVHFVEVGPDEGWFEPGTLLSPDDPAAQYLDPRPARQQIADLAAALPDLVPRLEAIEPGQQRDLAFELARNACQMSGLNQLHWVNDAFLAFGQTSSPEPWSTGAEGAWLMSHPRLGERTTLHDGVPVPAWPLALRAVKHAVGPDPGHALLLSLVAALQTAGDTRREDVLRFVEHRLSV
ncbi:hypothetical protein AB2L28_05840 [Kineococcus sp. TBRC 1896]|uniref:ADP-ribosylglycohydrolase n=1 Tax=Kineococcus mangrovi TaxID=1660183 RepID=A0ABV4I3A5_9ACTN